jgi:hypothetical protein
MRYFSIVCWPNLAELQPAVICCFLINWILLYLFKVKADHKNLIAGLGKYYGNATTSTGSTRGITEPSTGACSGSTKI